MQRALVAVALPALAFIIASDARSQQTSAAEPRAAGRIEAGQKVFQQHCAVCHSILPGATLVGPSLYHEMGGPAPAKPMAQVRAIILNGKGRMPGQKDKMSTKDLSDLLAYLRTL